jgi:uncharacterized membrane protein
MKKFFTLPLMALAGLLFIRGTADEKKSESDMTVKHGFEYPAPIKSIIDNKCYACHSIDGRSEEAKADLMWDSIPVYDKARQVAKLDEIIKVLEEGSMPPKQVVENNPDARISETDAKLLKQWAEKTADALLN